MSAAIATRRAAAPGLATGGGEVIELTGQIDHHHRPRLPEGSTSQLCRECRAAAVCSLGLYRYCTDCVNNIKNPIRARLGLPHIGLGYQHGQLRPDWGDGWAEVICDSCGATWVGPMGERCSWCVEKLARLQQRQAEFDLRSPMAEPGEATRDSEMKAWHALLVNAVKSGRVTANRARQAWDLEVNRDERANR